MGEFSLQHSVLCSLLGSISTYLCSIFLTQGIVCLLLQLPISQESLSFFVWCLMSQKLPFHIFHFVLLLVSGKTINLMSIILLWLKTEIWWENLEGDHILKLYSQERKKSEPTYLLPFTEIWHSSNWHSLIFLFLLSLPSPNSKPRP